MSFISTILPVALLATTSRACNYVGPASWGNSDHDDSGSDYGGYWYPQSTMDKGKYWNTKDPQSTMNPIYPTGIYPSIYPTEDYDNYNDNNYGGDSGVREPHPVDFCESGTDGNSSYSRMFLCAPWGLPYVFTFDSLDCTGDPNVNGIDDGDWECSSDALCNVFHVRKTDLAQGAACEGDSTNYGDYLTLADECITTIDDGGEDSISSFIATCDASTNTFEYKSYRGVPDCSGDANMTVSGASGTCHVVDDGEEQAYLEIVNCGSVSPLVDLEPAAETCSFIRHAVYTERESYHDGNGNYYENERNRTKEEARPLDHDLCLTHFREDSYSDELWFCSEAMGRAFRAVWYVRENEFPTQCKGEPSDVYIMDESAEGDFVCSDVNGACPYMHFRMSRFKDEAGSGDCSFSDNFGEMALLSDVCWNAEDDIAAKASCSVSGLVYSPYADFASCEAGGSSLSDITLTNDVCYILDGDEFGTEQTPGVPANYSYFQILSCNSVELNPRPECKFIENAFWEDPEDKKQMHNGGYYGGDPYSGGKSSYPSSTFGPWPTMDSTSWPDYGGNGGDSDYYYYKTGDGFKEPIGICISAEKSKGGESYMYICPPFGDDIAPVVVVWEGSGCGENGGVSYITETYSTDYSCDGSCDTILSLQMNQVADTDAGCKPNATDWMQKAFLPGCTMQMRYKNDSAEFSSTFISCDAATGIVTYDVYEEPGCSGASEGIVIDTESATPCVEVGDGPMYFELLQCGPNENVAGDECSYIVNPQYNSSKDGWRTRDGAIPLTTELCYSDYEDDYASTQYFCEFQSGLAFIALWNESLACSGFPDEIYEITSAVDDMVCASDDVSNCQYVYVSQGSIPANDECLPETGFQSDARLINVCWPGAGDSEITSWMVDCVDDTATIQVWATADCTGSVIQEVVAIDGECSTSFGDSDEQTFWKIEYCSVSSTEDTSTETPVEDTTTTVEEETTAEEEATTTEEEETSTEMAEETSTTEEAGTTEAVGTTEAEECEDSEEDGFCIGPPDSCHKTNKPDALKALLGDVLTCAFCAKDDAESICECEAIELSDLSYLPNKLFNANVIRLLLSFCWEEDTCDSIMKVSKVSGATACECESLECDISGDDVRGITPENFDDTGSGAAMYSVGVWFVLVLYAYVMQ